MTEQADGSQLSLNEQLSQTKALIRPQTASRLGSMMSREDSTGGEESKLAVPDKRESVTARATVFTLAAKINAALENDRNNKHHDRFGKDNYDSDSDDDDSSDDDSDSD